MRSSFIMPLVFAVCLAASAALAQNDLGGLGDFSGFGGFGGEEINPVAISAQWTAATSGHPALLMVTATIDSEWHIYSITQPKGGPLRTEIRLTPSDDYRLLGPFRPHPEPDSHVDQVVWKGLTIEEHEGQVTWYVPIEIREGVSIDTLTIVGEVRAQACKDSCLPPSPLSFTAKRGQGVEIGPVEVFETPPVERTGSAPSHSVPSHSARPVDPPENAGIYRAEGSVVTWFGWVDQGQASPGDQVVLHLRAQVPGGWHLFAFAPRDPQSGSKPTLIAFSENKTFQFGQPRTSDPLLEKKMPALPEFGLQRYHSGRATWTVPITIDRKARAGTYEIEGNVGYQACEGIDSELGSCELTKGMHFSATIEVGTPPDGAPIALALRESSYQVAAELAANQTTRHADPAVGPTNLVIPDAVIPDTAPAESRTGAHSDSSYDLSKIVFGATDEKTLPGILFLAFIGGMVLNLMPCVLPVIGLKIMSFVEQAGQSRRQAMLLNLWYSLGILAVFWVLGGLAIFAGLTWGGQFGNATFNILMISIVFAMALSLLGVWEIPIPGFLGSGASQNLSQKEGPFGAFLKGVVTTILATPCTGPGMAIALGWAVRQPVATTLLTFTVLGIGMAFPYLLIGAFPKLVAWLPKPGGWMETFKQLMGFVLMGTVVWLMMSLHSALLIPLLVLLTGIGIACWLVSRTPFTATRGRRLRAWGSAALVTTASALFAFYGLHDRVTLPRYETRLAQQANQLASSRASEVLAKIAEAGSAASMRETIAQLQAELTLGDGKPWQSFSLARLGKLTEKGQTVMVDFSAEWCPNCKVLEATVLHTEPVENAIEKNNVATLYADFTHYPPEISKTISALRANGIPVIAIFPGDDPYKPIVFQGTYTQASLIRAIADATGNTVSSNGVSSDTAPSDGVAVATPGESLR